MKAKIDFALLCDRDDDYWAITWNRKLIATVTDIEGIEEPKNQYILGARFLIRLQRQ